MGGPIQKGIVQYSLSSNAQVSLMLSDRILNLRFWNGINYIASVGRSDEEFIVQWSKTYLSILVLLATTFDWILLYLQISQNKVFAPSQPFCRLYILMLEMNFIIQKLDMLIWHNLRQKLKKRKLQNSRLRVENIPLVIPSIEMSNIHIFSHLYITI